MTSMSKIARVTTTVFFATMLAVAPAMAAKGGNGGGNGNGRGGNGSSASSKSSTSKGSTRAAAVSQTKKVKGVTASGFGRLNGFMNASATALAKTSPNSAIGQVSKVYAGLLASYLAPAPGTTAPTIQQVAAALAAAANKPLTAAQIAAINQKLLATNATLAGNLTTSGKTADELADEVATALGII